MKQNDQKKGWSLCLATAVTEGRFQKGKVLNHAVLQVIVIAPTVVAGFVLCDLKSCISTNYSYRNLISFSLIIKVVTSYGLCIVE